MAILHNTLNNHIQQLQPLVTYKQHVNIIDYQTITLETSADAADEVDAKKKRLFIGEQRVRGEGVDCSYLLCFNLLDSIARFFAMIFCKLGRIYDGSCGRVEG